MSTSKTKQSTGGDTLQPMAKDAVRKDATGLSAAESASKLKGKFGIEVTEQQQTLHLSGMLADLSPELRAESLELISHLTAVQTLDLSHNRLKALPKEISNMENLVQLNISHNWLTELPKELASLKALRWLIWSGNPIAALPTEFAGMPSLSSNQHLPPFSQHVPAAGLTIEEVVGKLKSEFGVKAKVTHEGKGLKISRQTYPNKPGKAWLELICSLESLEALEISNCKIPSLPNEIGKFKSLKTLDLSGNKLESIPSITGSLSGLQHLILRGNSLTSMPDGLGNLTNLKKLDLRGNKLASIPLDVMSLTDAEILSNRGINAKDSTAEGAAKNAGLAAQSFSIVGNKAYAAFAKSCGLVRNLAKSLASGFGILFPLERTKRRWDKARDKWLLHSNANEYYLRQYQKDELQTMHETQRQEKQKILDSQLKEMEEKGLNGLLLLSKRRRKERKELRTKHKEEAVVALAKHKEERESLRDKQETELHELRMRRKPQ